LEKARATLPIKLSRSRIELAKTRTEHEKTEKKLSQLKADRERLTVKSPVAGVVYYGNCRRGVWANQSETAAKLRPGGTATAAAVLMTVVDPGSLVVCANVPEKDIANVRDGATAVVIPTCATTSRLEGKVTRVSPIPVGKEGFACDVQFDLPAGKPRIVAGMTCKVEIQAYALDRATLVPSKAVRAGGDAGQDRYVMVQVENGSPKRRVVTIGHEVGELTQITSGLNPGEVVLLESDAD
jgi:multidrug efflux pump subunit AcrA (membrane-fusion protein)